MTARLPFRPVLIALTSVALALSLGACGRKGPLDLPPTAQATSTSTAAAAPAEEKRELVPGSIFDSPTRDAEPEEARGKKKKFILDPLLGDK